MDDSNEKPRLFSLKPLSVDVKKFYKNYFFSSGVKDAQKWPLLIFDAR
jgi:hypothetical protein